MRTNLARLLFSSDGRLPRSPFLIAGGLLLAFEIGFQAVVPAFIRVFVGWAVYAVVLFCAACLLSKRLHDRGRRGWWSLLILWAAIVVWPEPDGFIDALWCAPLLLAAVELGLLPGQRGANRFGPPPTERLSG